MCGSIYAKFCKLVFDIILYFFFFVFLVAVTAEI